MLKSFKGWVVIQVNIIVKVFIREMARWYSHDVSAKDLSIHILYTIREKLKKKHP